MQPFIVLVLVGFVSGNPVETSEDYNNIENPENVKLDIFCIVKAIQDMVGCFKKKNQTEWPSEFSTIEPSWSEGYSAEYLRLCNMFSSSESESDSLWETEENLSDSNSPSSEKNEEKGLGVDFKCLSDAIKNLLVCFVKLGDQSSASESPNTIRDMLKNYIR